MEHCIFSQLRQCTTDNTCLMTPGAKRIETIKSCSKIYSDNLHVLIEEKLKDDTTYVIKSHKDCISTYTSKHHISRALKRTGDTSTDSNRSPKKRRRRSEQPNFDFFEQCLFCGEKCEVTKDSKHPERWRPAYVCRTAGDADLKSAILKTCLVRNDNWADQVRLRVQGAISDLHAADARYHVNCKSSFMSPKNVNVANTSVQSSEDDLDVAFEYVIGLMLEDKSRVWNSIEIFDIYSSEGGVKMTRRRFIECLSTRFGEDLLVLSASGVASIIVFKSKAPSLLRVVNDYDDSEIDAAIKIMAKRIMKDVSDCTLDKTKYSTRLTTEKVQQPVSDTLMRLLAKLSSKLENTPPAHLIGNIITSSLRNVPTALQVALGVMVRDSKCLVSQLSSFGVTCTYDELQRFKKSAAVAASASTNKQGISDCKSGLVQVVVDNFDADISSQNGKISTHSLAMLVTQTGELNTESDNDESIKRIELNQMYAPIDYDIDTETYTGPKKPDMPLYASKKTVPSLKILTEMAISSNRAKEADLSFFSDIYLSENCPEYNGYNARISREQGHATKPKTKSMYLPLIDMTPADPRTIKTAMKKAHQITTDCGQKFTVMTGDLQLYKIAVNVLWAQPKEFDHFIVRLGGMHTLMSFAGAVGTLMGGSGLIEILESTFGGVQKMIIGKKYPQNTRAFRLLAEELLRPILETGNLACFSDLQGVLDDIAARSKTSKVWIDCFIRCVFIMMMFVRAEREGDWALHLTALRCMLPYFFASGHVNYARYGLYYLRSMESMPEDCCSRFMNGEHVMRHNAGIWNAIWSDMFIETTFMRYGHGKKGIIGITLKPETLKTWSLSLHICSRLEEDIRSLTTEDADVIQNRHKEERLGRIKADSKDSIAIRDKLQECINPLDPDDHPKEIVNVVSGKVSPDAVNVDRALEIGQKQMSDFENSWPEGFNEKISRMVKTQADAGKFLKVGDVKVFDTELIYSRVIGLQASTRDVDVKRLLTYELSPVPTSMFSETGEMRIAKGKSTLKNVLKKEVSSRLLVKLVPTVIIDGSAILYIIHWPPSGTIGEYVTGFRKYVARKLALHDVYLIFDRYQDYSTKGVTRSGRGSAHSRIHQLSLTMQLPPKKNIMSVQGNKQQLIQLIVDDLEKHALQDPSINRKLVITGQNETPIEINMHVKIEREDMRTTHEEADNILVQQMVYVVKETGKDVSVISDDTDVFALLLHHYISQGLTQTVIMESPVQDRASVDIKTTALEHASIIPDILAAHALSGCDTTACYFGIGKGTVIKVLRAGKVSLNCVGDYQADFESVLKVSTEFIAACYGHRPVSESMSAVRQRIWASKVGKSPSIAPKLCSLPPTTEAFTENVKRAHLQTCIWKDALELEAPNLDPVLFGWEKIEETRSLSPVMLQKNILLAPTEILQMIKCACESSTPCATARCRCNSARLSCTIFCACQGSVVCNNEQTKHT